MTKEKKKIKEWEIVVCPKCNEILDKMIGKYCFNCSCEGKKIKVVKK